MTHRLANLWLTLACLLALLAGLVAAAASSPALDAPWHRLLSLLAGLPEGALAPFDETARQLNAVLGGVMVGWALLLLAIVRGPFRRGDYALARPILLSVLAWFLVDSAGSLIAGLPGNILLNLGFLLLFVPPLLRLQGRS